MLLPGCNVACCWRRYLHEGLQLNSRVLGVLLCVHRICSVCIPKMDTAQQEATPMCTGCMLQNDGMDKNETQVKLQSSWCVDVLVNVSVSSGCSEAGEVATSHAQGRTKCNPVPGQQKRQGLSQRAPNPDSQQPLPEPAGRAKFGVTQLAPQHSNNTLRLANSTTCVRLVFGVNLQPSYWTTLHALHRPSLS